MSLRSIAPAVLLMGALATAPSALADSTTTQDVPPGGTISTGSTVSKADPAQMSITAPAGGTFTIQKISSPTYPESNYVGPEFQVTPPEQPSQQLTVTFLIDPSIMPRAGNQGEVSGRAGATLIENYMPGSTQPTVFFPQTPNSAGVQPGQPITTAQNLPNGDVQFTLPQGRAGAGSFFIAHKAWNVEIFGRNQDLGTALRKGIGVDAGCTLWCEQDVTVQVSHSVARQLKLAGTTVGSGKIDGPTGTIALSAAFKRAMKRYNKVVVTEHDVVTSPDTPNRSVENPRITLSSELG